MVPDQQRLSIDERANLVAYLDGELNDAQTRAIATKLTQSLTARKEVEALQKTWELLDLLPRPKASEDFTARTLSVATQPGGRPDRVGRVGPGPPAWHGPGLDAGLGRRSSSSAIS